MIYSFNQMLGFCIKTMKHDDTEPALLGWGALTSQSQFNWWLTCTESGCRKGHWGNIQSCDILFILFMWWLFSIHLFIFSTPTKGHQAGEWWALHIMKIPWHHTAPSNACCTFATHRLLHQTTVGVIWIMLLKNSWGWQLDSSSLMNN